MHKEAVLLGRKIVEKERFLDHLFASQKIDEEKLRGITREIGTLQGDLRAVHLKAHLEMKEILTPHQIHRYDELRGYLGGGGEHKHQGGHGGHH
jgi:Spy/CpxP family protein refolding chaperone